MPFFLRKGERKEEVEKGELCYCGEEKAKFEMTLWQNSILGLYLKKDWQWDNLVVHKNGFVSAI